MNSTTTPFPPMRSRREGDSASPALAALRAWSVRLGSIVWYEMQAFGARRALREMRMMGFGTDIAPTALIGRMYPSVPVDKPPQDAALLSEATRQAADVRELARRCRPTMPGFAADPDPAPDPRSGLPMAAGTYATPHRHDLHCRRKPMTTTVHATGATRSPATLPAAALALLSATGEAIAGLARGVWEVLKIAGNLSAELERVADEWQDTCPEQAARLRDVARRGWDW